MTNVTIYTDGSCLRNGMDNPKAGWAAILTCGKHEKRLSGRIEGTATNNVAELTAVIQAVSALKTDAACEVEIVSDSKYVTDAINLKYVHNWVKNGWRTVSKAPVANKEMWQKLIAVCREHKDCTFTFTHVDGHSGHEMNTLCDKLAKAAASK